MHDQVKLFGISFDRVRMPEAVEQILAWCSEPAPKEGQPCRFVVTPNVDHAVLFQERDALRNAYAEAALVLVDGAPIVWASRMLRQALPERVAGSDLVPALFDAASRATTRGLAGHHRRDGRAESSEQIVPVPITPSDPEAADTAARSLKIFLLGAAPGVAERASRRIMDAWPEVSVVGTYSPPLGFETDAAENERILQAIADAAPDLVIIGLGAPKQEIWTHAHRSKIRAKVALCAGATIDFLAGEKRRSPRWMRRIGLEWLHRALSEPRRLAGRYARDARIFPQLVWRQWRSDLRA